MIKKMKKGLICGCLSSLAAFFPLANIQAQVESDESYKEDRSLQKKDSDPLLLADNINSGFELLAVDSMLLQIALKEEQLMFPASDLYDEDWNTEIVKAYANKEIPETYHINVSDFIMPFEGRITSNYGPRRRRFHYGTDLKVQVGDTIRAAFDGKVRIKRYEKRGYGYYLVLRHPNGLETVYGHLSGFLVDQNEIVRAGDPIALGGNTGRSTGSHLHFETRFLGIDINPSEIIDFTNGVPHQDMYVFRNVKINGKKSNIYTTTESQMVYHRVKSGDNLGKIARMYGTTVNELCRLNGLKGTSTLRVGQSIRCSLTGGKQTASSSTTTKVNTVKASTAAVASLPANTQSQSATNGPVYYRVKSGDTLGAIATKHGTTIEKLCQLNGITKTTILKLGRSLRCS